MAGDDNHESYSVELTKEHADYIYCGGATTRKVWKIRKSDMSKVKDMLFKDADKGKL